MRGRSGSRGGGLGRLAAALMAVGALFGGLATASAQTASSGWQPGPGAVLDNTYDGYVDQPAAGATVAAGAPITISGWFVDRTAQGWAGVDDVHVYEGFPRQGGTFVTHGTFARSRPDVAQALGNPYWIASGFLATIPANTLALGPHTLGVYVHTPDKGWWYKQVTVTIAQVAPTTPTPSATTSAGAAGPINVILQPDGKERISIKSDSYTAKGYALDPLAGVSQGTGIDRVQVYLDEQRGTDGSTYIGDAEFGGSTPTIAGQYGDRFMESGWHIDFKPSDFKAGNHHLYVYARSSLTGKETLAYAGFDMFDPSNP